MRPSRPCRLAHGSGAVATAVARHVPPNAVEAPFVTTHDGWYYLFASFDSCCRGVERTYHVVVGRSRSADGPYVDRDGRALTAGGGSPFLDAVEDMRGPGGESVTSDGRQHDPFAFHHYDAAAAGPFSLGLARLAWHDGWPMPVHLRIRDLEKGTS